MNGCGHSFIIICSVLVDLPLESVPYVTIGDDITGTFP